MKSGTTIVILDRNKPVARLEPVGTDTDTNSDRVARLVRQGLLNPAKRQLDVEKFLAWKRTRLPNGIDAVQYLAEERGER